MPHSHPLRARLVLLTVTLGACTTAPPSPPADDHPASIHAPAAPVQAEPSALTAYRDFTAASTPPKAPATDHSMHEQHEQGASSPAQDDQEGTDENHR